MASPIVPSPIICTGQMRAGTTWLYETCKQSNNIWCPPAKELRLLYAIDELGTTTCLERFAPFGRADAIGRESKSWKDITWTPYLRAMIDQCQAWLRDGFSPLGALELEFWMTYLGQPHDLALYRRLAELVAPRSLLDATPDYATLSTPFLTQLRDTFDRPPRFIISLREPEQRLRSHVRLDMAAGTVTLDASAEDQIRYFEEMMNNNTNFMQVNIDHHIERLISVFGSESIFIVFFEDIKNAPGILCDKMAFYCETTITSYPTIPENPGLVTEIPEPLGSLIRNAALPVTERLATMLGGHAINWLKAAHGEGLDPNIAGTVHSGRLDKLLH